MNPQPGTKVPFCEKPLVKIVDEVTSSRWLCPPVEIDYSNYQCLMPTTGIPKSGASGKYDGIWLRGQASS